MDLRSGIALGLTFLLIACGGADDAPPPGPATGGPSGTIEPTPSPGFGGSPPASGIARWSSRLGGSLGDYGRAVAADSQGNVLVVGMFDGSADLGGVTMNSRGMFDLFVAKFTPAGKPSWVRHYGGAG